MSDIADLIDSNDTVGLAALVASGEVSSLELVDAAISRIEDRNPTLNAVVGRRFEAARAEAADPVDGPFSGVPFLVKDLGCDVEGLQATRGSRLFADVIATRDSELTQRFERAGLIILGNTNTPEFGKNASTEPLLFGPSHNPWNLGHSTGGSSGGSAAAVSGGMVTAAHANDGGGSIRIPASECGLVGLKPSRGRTPNWPLAGMFSYPVSCAHVVTRTVRDSAAILDAIGGGLPGDPFPAPGTPDTGTFLAAIASAPRRLRIAMSTDSPNGKGIHPAGIAAIERTARILEDLGHEIVPTMPQFDHTIPGSVVSTIMGVASAHAVETRLAVLGRSLQPGDLEPFSEFLHGRSLEVTGFEMHEALNQLEVLSRQFGEFHQTYDLWLTATLAVPSPELGHLDTSSIEAMFTRAARFSELTAPFNVTGQPAMSVPAGFDEAGLPVGVQLVGPLCSEALLLQVAAQLEQAQPWPLLAPWPPST